MWQLIVTHQIVLCLTADVSDLFTHMSRMGVHGELDAFANTRRGFMEVGNLHQPAVPLGSLPGALCTKDSECDLYAPLCVNGRCSIRFLNVSMGQCICSPGEEKCKEQLQYTMRNITATACLTTCQRNSACAAAQESYIDSGDLICKLFGFENVTNIRDTHASLIGNGENRAACYAKPVEHSQCLIHPLCAPERLGGQEFCCPDRQGVMMECCHSTSVDVSVVVSTVLGVLLLCSCLCNLRHWCAPREQALVSTTPLSRAETDVRSFNLSQAGINRGAQHALWEELQVAQKQFVVFLNAGSGDQRSEGEKFKELVDSMLSPNYLLPSAEHYDNFAPFGSSYMLPHQLDAGMKAAVDGLRQNKDVRILACGGDGTVTWILSTLQSKSREEGFREIEHWPPPVGIIPMGTGNDLARSLGWGAALTDTSELIDYIRRALHAQTVELDQWKLTLKPTSFLPPALAATSPIPQFVGYFTNYFSVGMDAKTALDVSEARRRQLGKCCFRMRCPKPFQAVHGGFCCYAANAPNILKCWCCRTQALNSSDDGMTVDLDERTYNIPGEVRQFTLTNLNSYGAGMLLYDNEAMAKVKPNDGKLEVFTREGPWSVLGMTVAKKVLKSPCGSVRMTEQASSVKMTLKKGEFFQMDGEPWILNNGCEAEVALNCKVRMLCPLAQGSGAGIWARCQERSFWTRQQPSGVR